MERAAFDVRLWLSNDQPQQVPVVRPKCVSCWSKDSATVGGGYQYGSTAGLSTFKQPQLPQALGAGYPESYVRKDDGESTPVEVVIRGAVESGFPLDGARFCTFRNNLNKLLQTPLSPGDEWTIDACWYKGTMFLDIVKMPQRDFPGSDLFTFYGYKFEALCSASPHGVVDSSSEFALLLSLKLGSHSILMAAEVDCASPEGASPSAGSAEGLKPEQFMELKTTKLAANPRQRERNLAQKFPRWWVQSFLAGIPTIVVGGRDDKGLLTEVFQVPVAALPSQAAAAGQPFDAWQLLRFADSALSWMYDQGKARPEQHLRFKYEPSRKSIDFSVVLDGPLPGRLQEELGAESS